MSNSTYLGSQHLNLNYDKETWMFRAKPGQMRI